MILKMLGVIFVVVGCGSVGFKIAANYRLEERSLRQLVGILDYMECELKYRLTPLPDLCRQVSNEFCGIPGNILFKLIREMESQIAPDVTCCMNAVLARSKDVPIITRGCLEQLGMSIGKYDLNGQIIGIEAVREECKRNLKLLTENRDSRLRSYQTLGLCAGAALAILFI